MSLSYFSYKSIYLRLKQKLQNLLEEISSKNHDSRLAIFAALCIYGTLGAGRQAGLKSKLGSDVMRIRSVPVIAM